MEAEPPSPHAVPSRIRYGMRASPLGGMGGPPPKIFYILRSRGCILGNYFLANLALCRGSFNCNSHKLQLFDKSVMIIKKVMPITNL